MLYIVILNQVLLSQLGFMLIVGNGVPMEEREDRREEKQDRNNIHKNCAFCDRSMKFGIHVDLAILNTFRYGATCNTF